MKRAAVCVGVNNAGSLGVLEGAAAGAEEFAAWARKQGGRKHRHNNPPDS